MKIQRLEEESKDQRLRLRDMDKSYNDLINASKQKTLIKDYDVLKNLVAKL